MPDQYGRSKAISDALNAFQMIEESLKRSITTCYAYIRSTVRDQFPFTYSRPDIENVPLGGLLEIYRKISANEELINALKSLPKDRNFVAHRAFVHDILEAEESPEQFAAETRRIEEIAKHAYAVLRMMVEEMNQLTARLERTLNDEKHDG